MFEGISGWMAAKVMARMNADAEAEAVSRLAPLPGSRILVIGFGPGVGLQLLLARPVAQVVGIDPSAIMVRLAGDRNRGSIQDGRLQLLSMAVEHTELPSATFDGAIAVHTLQICHPFRPAADQLARLLKPGAKLVAITHAWVAAKDHGSTAAFCETVSQGLIAAGFAEVRQGFATAESGQALLTEAVR